MKTAGWFVTTVGTANAATGGRFCTVNVFCAVAESPASSVTRSRTVREPGMA